MKPSIIVFALTLLITNSSSLQLLKQWNFISYDLPPHFDPQNFKPENTVPTGIEITNGRIFVSIPRLRSGVAATLTSIPINDPKNLSPTLQAYPDWSLHGAGSGDYNCSGLISVYRTRVDSCGRLWVLDAGTLDTIENFRRVCPPKILIFDLKIDQVVRTIIFPREVLQAASIFTNLIIDESIQGKCDSAFVYISDTIAPGIVVYDGSNDKTWRFSHPSMFPNPDHANINIAGEQFALMDGIIGLAHSPQVATVFYQAVATDRIFSIPTATLTKGPPAEFEELPITVAGKKSSQGLPLAMNEDDNTLFFSPMTETSIAAWNVVNNNQQVLVTDPVNLQFVAELRWKSNGYLYILSSRFHKFFRRTVTPNETNIRILRLPLKQAPAHFPGFSPNFYFK